MSCQAANVEQHAITLRINAETFTRIAAAAAASGRTPSAHAAALLERVDPDLDAMPHAPDVDEVAERRARQLATLEREGLLTDDVRVLLQPEVLPRALASARDAARRGGPGWAFYGKTVGAHVRTLLAGDTDELDVISAMPTCPLAIAKLEALLDSRLPAVLGAVASRHRRVVLDAAFIELASTASGEDS